MTKYYYLYLYIRKVKGPRLNLEITEENGIFQTFRSTRKLLLLYVHIFTYFQLGHEPISPRQVKTFFGRPALQLPSVFKYVATIKQKDGFLALYR